MHAVEYVVCFCYQELEAARASHIEIQERIESEKQRQTLQSSPEVNGATQRIEAQEIEVRDSSSLTTFLLSPIVHVSFNTFVIIIKCWCSPIQVLRESVFDRKWSVVVYCCCHHFMTNDPWILCIVLGGELPKTQGYFHIGLLPLKT